MHTILLDNIKKDFADDTKKTFGMQYGAAKSSHLHEITIR